MRGVSASDCQALVDAIDEVKRREMALKRKHWPSYRGELIVTNSSAFLVSPKRHAVRYVWQRTPPEYLEQWEAFEEVCAEDAERLVAL